MENNKKYAEALERAKDCLKDGGISKNTIAYLEEIFPELTESEDERIKKELIHYFSDGVEFLSLCSFSREEIVAWLEKQGEQKPIKCNKEWYNFVRWFVKERTDNYTLIPSDTDIHTWGDIILDHAKKELEKQGEQNPYSGVSFKYDGHTWGMCARDNGVEILVDGEIKERVFLDNKPQGKTALETAKEEKIDNSNKAEPKDYNSIDPYFAKPIDKVEPKFKVGDKVYNIKNRFECIIESIDDTAYYCDTTNFDIKDQNNWELVEQKPTDKVEPKFKVGDWIVDNCGYVWKIEGILNQFYILEGIEGGESRPTIEWVDKTFHLWNIADAKDGDVLWHSDSASNGIFIFKEIRYDGKVLCYCDYDSEDHFCTGEHHTCCWSNAKCIKPATKEQRDLLFQKMKEAGYEWDAEKKESKKIEPIENKDVELTDFESALFTAFSDAWQQYLRGEEVNVAQWAKEHSSELLEVARQELAEWSEEDETHRHWILEMLKAGEIKTPEFADHFKAAFNWLKSLRPQNH